MSKLHLVGDSKGCPLNMHISEGQMNNYTRTMLLIDAFLKADALLADRGNDADCFRYALAELGITTDIPSKMNREVPIRNDRCAHIFMSAI
jgi:putative transposase